jgi:hypothetical protein
VRRQDLLRMATVLVIAILATWVLNAADAAPNVAAVVIVAIVVGGGALIAMNLSGPGAGHSPR